jgi:LmbE family N-acetylglucosaminyl deacetylase
LGADFVQAGGRRLESNAGLRHLGVPVARQFYLELPDGRMAGYTDELDERIEDIVQQVRPDRIFTTGEDGYDGHPDHVATHFSVLRTAAKLQRLGSAVTVWSLNMSERNGLLIPGLLEVKLGAMDEHPSQKTVGDLTLWGGTDFYTPVILGPEVYSQELGVDQASGPYLSMPPSYILSGNKYET